MFKILAVICSLSGECHPFISDHNINFATLKQCDQEAGRVADKMFAELEPYPEFGSMKIGCVSSDWVLPEN